MENSTLCSVMMSELWTRKRGMGYEDENNVEDTSGYETSAVQLAWLNWETSNRGNYTPDRNSYLLYKRL
jgi:nitrate reductase beta subunit